MPQPRGPQWGGVSKKSSGKSQKPRNRCRWTPDEDENRRIAKIIANAFYNPSVCVFSVMIMSLTILVKLGWDVKEYSNAQCKSVKRFPHPEKQLVDRPAILIDNKGQIILWYLPG